MDAQESWQAFACTGNILRYLDYKQQTQPEKDSAGAANDRPHCDDGSCTERDPL